MTSSPAAIGSWPSREPGAIEAPADALVIDATGGWVTPGFIDVQINGGHGIDLTSEPERADELGCLLRATA